MLTALAARTSRGAPRRLGRGAYAGRGPPASTCRPTRSSASGTGSTTPPGRPRRRPPPPSAAAGRPSGSPSARARALEAVRSGARATGPGARVARPDAVDSASHVQGPRLRLARCAVELRDRLARGDRRCALPTGAAVRPPDARRARGVHLRRRAWQPHAPPASPPARRRRARTRADRDRRRWPAGTRVRLRVRSGCGGCWPRVSTRSASSRRTGAGIPTSTTRTRTVPVRPTPGTAVSCTTPTSSTRSSSVSARVRHWPWTRSSGLLLETAGRPFERAGIDRRERCAAATRASSSAPCAGLRRRAARGGAEARGLPAHRQPRACRVGPDRVRLRSGGAGGHGRHRVFVVAGGRASGRAVTAQRRVLAGAGRRCDRDGHARHVHRVQPAAGSVSGRAVQVVRRRRGRHRAGPRVSGSCCWNGCPMPTATGIPYSP